MNESPRYFIAMILLVAIACVLAAIGHETLVVHKGFRIVGSDFLKAWNGADK